MTILILKKTFSNNKMDNTLNDCKDICDKTYTFLTITQEEFKPFDEKKVIVVDFINNIMQKSPIKNITYQKTFIELIGESGPTISKLKKPESYGPMISLVNKIYNFLINKKGFYSDDSEFNCFIETEFYKAIKKQKDVKDCLDFDLIEEYGEDDFWDKYRLSLRKYLRVVNNNEKSSRYILSSNTLYELILRKDKDILGKVSEIDFSSKNITLKTAVELLRQIVLGKDNNGYPLFPRCCSIDLSYNFILPYKYKNLDTEFIKLLSEFVSQDNGENLSKTIYLCNNIPTIHDDWLDQCQNGCLKNSIILHY